MFTSKAVGDEAEAQALLYLQRQGMKLVQRNYRVAAGPHRRGGEVDLILKDRDGSLVFVEVRSRKARLHGGGAAASIGATKRQRIVYAAQHYLQHMPSPPPCRFDVVLIEAGQLEWLPAAFDAS